MTTGNIWRSVERLNKDFIYWLFYCWAENKRKKMWLLYLRLAWNFIYYFIMFKFTWDPKETHIDLRKVSRSSLDEKDGMQLTSHWILFRSQTWYISSLDENSMETISVTFL